MQITFDKFSIVDSDLPQIYLRFYAKFGPVGMRGLLAYSVRVTWTQINTQASSISLCIILHTLHIMLMLGMQWARPSWQCSILSVITHANDSPGSKAFICISLYICLYVRMIKPKRLKLHYQTFHRVSPWILPIHLILAKVIGQGHRSQSAKTYWRRSSGRRELCTLSSAQPLVSTISHSIVSAAGLLVATDSTVATRDCGDVVRWQCVGSRSVRLRCHVWRGVVVHGGFSHPYHAHTDSRWRRRRLVGGRIQRAHWCFPVARRGRVDGWQWGTYIPSLSAIPDT